MNSFFKGSNQFNLIYDGILNEGISASYPIETVVSDLTRSFKNILEVDYFPYDIQKRYADSKFGISTSLSFSIQNETAKQYKELVRKIKLCGYYISKRETEDNITFTYLVEPRFPADITGYIKQNNISQLYHITETKNIEKIKKIGLVSKESKTTAYHPDDRIYLLYSSKNNILSFRRVLAKNKNVSIDNLAVLSVDVLPNAKYYIDDTTYMPTTKNIVEVLACFTFNAIRPTNVHF